MIWYLLTLLTAALAATAFLLRRRTPLTAVALAVAMLAAGIIVEFSTPRFSTPAAGCGVIDGVLLVALLRGRRTEAR